MLIATIDDKKDNIYTEIYLNNKDGKLELSGFSIENGKVTKVTDKILSYFNYFILGSNFKKLGSRNGYEMFLDMDTRLIYFYKDGRPNYEMFFNFNGKEATLCSGPIPKYTGRKKKFEINFLSIIASFSVFLAIQMATNSNLGIRIEGEFVPIKTSIVYILAADEEAKLSSPATIESIKDYIYSSEHIPTKQIKDFLWNKELVETILPYYDGSPLDIVTKIKHWNIGIESYSENDYNGKTTLGYYSYDNVLHVKDFDEYEFSEDSAIAEVLAHEYIHLLESSDGYPIIKEAVAEIVANEFYMNSCRVLNYETPCRGVKILMEVIGTEPIWDNCFRNGSTAIEDAIRSYLSESEYSEFIHILSLHPHHDMKELSSLYGRFDELLDILYYNKFGQDISEDKMISTLRNAGKNNLVTDNWYSRFYFCKSAMEENQDFCIEDCVVPFTEAVDEKLIELKKEVDITEDVFFSDAYGEDEKLLRIRINLGDYTCEFSVQNNKLVGDILLPIDAFTPAEQAERSGYFELSEFTLENEAYFKVRVKTPEEDYIEIVFKDDNTIHSVTLSDGTFLSQEQEYDYLKVDYVAIEPVDIYEFKQNYLESDRYFTTGEGGVINLKENTLRYPKKTILPPITEKFASFEEEKMYS